MSTIRCAFYMCSLACPLARSIVIIQHKVTKCHRLKIWAERWNVDIHASIQWMDTGKIFLPLHPSYFSECVWLFLMFLIFDCGSRRLWCVSDLNIKRRKVEGCFEALMRCAHKNSGKCYAITWRSKKTWQMFWFGAFISWHMRSYSLRSWNAQSVSQPVSNSVIWR